MKRPAVAFVTIATCAVTLVATAFGIARAQGVTAATVSADTQTVYGTRAGRRIVLLRACAHESFETESDGPLKSPWISPDGRWVLVGRAWPLRRRGSIDESEVLYDVATGRSFVSNFYDRRFGVGTPLGETWVSGAPATLDVKGTLGERRVVLPGPLAGVVPPTRCPALPPATQ